MEWTGWQNSTEMVGLALRVIICSRKESTLGGIELYQFVESLQILMFWVVSKEIVWGAESAVAFEIRFWSNFGENKYIIFEYPRSVNNKARYSSMGLEGIFVVLLSMQVCSAWHDESIALLA